MLLIRSEQMEAFRLARAKEVEDDLIRRVIALQPQRSDEAEPALREFVRRAMEIAAQFAIRDHDALARFLPFVCRYGLQVTMSAESRWTRAILYDAEATTNEKLSRLETHEDRS